MSKNQQCLEKILERLTNLIIMAECDTKELNKLVSMANSTSAQLTEAIRVENNIESDNEDNLR